MKDIKNSTHFWNIIAIIVLLCSHASLFLYPGNSDIIGFTILGHIVLLIVMLFMSVEDQFKDLKTHYWVVVSPQCWLAIVIFLIFSLGYFLITSFNKLLDGELKTKK
jgi:hypothetical protein